MPTNSSDARVEGSTGVVVRAARVAVGAVRGDRHEHTGGEPTSTTREQPTHEQHSSDSAVTGTTHVCPDRSRWLGAGLCRAGSAKIALCATNPPLTAKPQVVTATTPAGELAANSSSTDSQARVGLPLLLVTVCLATSALHLHCNALSLGAASPHVGVRAP